MRKCLCPSEPGIDDEGASHKLQAVGTAPHMTTNHHMLRVQTSAPSPLLVAVPTRASFGRSCQRRRNATNILRCHPALPGKMPLLPGLSLPSPLSHELQPPVVHMRLAFCVFLPQLPLLLPGPLQLLCPPRHRQPA